MAILDDVKIQLPEVDIKAEVFAAELFDNGIDLNNFYFRNISSFKRNFEKDISGIKKELDKNNTENVVLEVNREGLYDMLPEEFFHHQVPDKFSKQKGKSYVIEEIKKRRQEELEARIFFEPFQNEFYQLRLASEISEKSLLQSASSNQNRKLFENIFGDSSILNDSQLFLLLHILPSINNFRGNIVKTEFIFSLILGYKITIIKNKSSFVKEFLLSNNNYLGNIMLGVNCICGSSFLEQENHFEIKVVDIVYNDLINFFDDKPKYKLLEYLINFFFPANYSYTYLFEVKKDERVNFLSTKEKSCFLSVNSYL